MNDVSVGTRVLQAHPHSTAARAFAIRAEEGKRSGGCHHNGNCGSGEGGGAVANDSSASLGDVTRHRDPVGESASEGNQGSRGRQQRTPPSSPPPPSSSPSAPSSTTHRVPSPEKEARAAKGVLKAMARKATTETFDAVWDIAEKGESPGRALVAGGVEASEEASVTGGVGELDDDPREEDGGVRPTGERHAHKMWVTNSSGDNSVSGKRVVFLSIVLFVFICVFFRGSDVRRSVVVHRGCAASSRMEISLARLPATGGHREGRVPETQARSALSPRRSDRWRKCSFVGTPGE